MTGSASPTTAHALTVQLDLGPPVLLGSADGAGLHAMVTILGGQVYGPRLHGRVMPGSGADYARVRPDRVVDLDARYLIEVDDGTVIMVRNRGFRWASSDEVDERLRAGEPVDPADYYLRTAPRFEVATGPHDWLTRHVFVGIGRRTARGNVIDYHQLF